VRVVGRDELLDREGPKRSSYTQYKRYVLARAGVDVDADEYDEGECGTHAEEPRGLRIAAMRAFDGYPGT
jgi:hypothetical protein